MWGKQINYILGSFFDLNVIIYETATQLFHSMSQGESPARAAPTYKILNSNAKLLIIIDYCTELRCKNVKTFAAAVLGRPQGRPRLPEGPGVSVSYHNTT